MKKNSWRFQVEQKLDCSGVAVPRFPRQFAEPPRLIRMICFRSSSGRLMARGDFDHFLVPPSAPSSRAPRDASRFPCVVAEDLHFDVLRPGFMYRSINTSPRFRRPRLPASRCASSSFRGSNSSAVFHHAHAPAAAAKCRLHNQRKTDLARQFLRRLRANHRFFRPWNHGNSRPLRQLPRFRFVAQ